MKGSATGSLKGEVEEAGDTETSGAASTSPVVDATQRDVKLALKESFNDMRPLRPSTWLEDDGAGAQGAPVTGGETVEANEAAMKAKLKEIREQKKKDAQAKKMAKKGQGKGTASEEKPKKAKKTEEASRPRPQTQLCRTCEKTRSGRISPRTRLSIVYNEYYV